MNDVIKNGVDTYLGFWARMVVRVRRPTIVGVTGSVGKTTTKETIAAVLSHPDARARVGRVRKSPENLNDNRGLPLVLLGYDDWVWNWRLAAAVAAAPWRALRLAVLGPYPDLLVLEYAASDHGDIPWLVRLAPPTVAVVTAIGPAHLEHFGTIDRLVQEKGALVEAIPRDGLAVLGLENAHASSLDRKTDARVVKVAGKGRALADNAARAVGRFFGVANAVIDRALPAGPTVRGRLDVRELGDLTLIDDSFNANPLSMELGLSTLAGHARVGQRKVAILGDMLELGRDSPRYHREIGEYARSVADVVVGVGALAKSYQPDRWYPTADACSVDLESLLCSGDLVFVKGSAGIELYRTVTGIKRVARERAVRRA